MEVIGDSKLVIRQMNEKYKCVNENLLEYYKKARDLLNRFIKVRLEYVLRSLNGEDNELAQIASSIKFFPGNTERNIRVEKVNHPSVLMGQNI